MRALRRVLLSLFDKQNAVARALKRVLAEDQFLATQGLLADPLVLPKIATALGIDERVLTNQVAAQLDLGFVHRIASYNETLPDGLTFHMLRNSASIVTRLPSGSRGIITASLPLAEPLLELLGTRQVALASLQDILAALDESERQQQPSSVEARYSPERLARFAVHILGTLLEQSSNDGQAEISLKRSNGSLSYTFELPNQKRACGSIQPVVTDAVWSFLRRNADSGKLNIKTEDGKEFGPFDLTMSNDNSAVLRSQRLSLPDSRIESNVLPFPISTTPAPLADEVAPPDCTPAHLESAGPSTVLVVDDNPTFVRVLERYFDRHGLQVRHANDGKQALSMLDASLPDLVVCDIHMPGMNGSDFLKCVRGQSSWDDLPFVMLTSDDDIELKLRLLNLGADAYISKNEDPRLLCVQAHRLIARSKKRRAA